MGFFKDLFSNDEEEDEGRPRYADLIEEAKAMVEEERYEEALVECDRALMANPRCAPALALKAWARGKLSNTIEEMSEALGFMDAAMKLDPNDETVKTVYVELDEILRRVEER